MNSKMSISQEQVEFFNQEGYLIIPDFYDLEEEIRPIQRQIYDIIGLVAEKYAIPLERVEFSEDSFDQGYVDLISKNRICGSEIYDAVKQIPAFIRLVSSKKNEHIFQILRPGSLPGIAAAGYGVRINNPFEDKFRATWHQEYPSQLRSLDGLVFWSPFVPVTPEIGPVMILAGSHVEGAVPVYSSDPKNAEKKGAYGLVMGPEDQLLQKYSQISPPSRPSDLIVMDFLLIHASGINISNRALWSMQMRYFNYKEPVGRNHGWKGGFASGVDFTAIHPELSLK